MLIAFCGTDGSLLEPPAVMETEAWLHIETLLDPLLHCLKRTRQEAGFPVEHTTHAFHATDSYHKHKNKLASLYNRIWPELYVHPWHLTPKAGCQGARHLPPFSSRCLITGEPVHDIINLRRLISPYKCDGQDFFP